MYILSLFGVPCMSAHFRLGDAGIHHPISTSLNLHMRNEVNCNEPIWLILRSFRTIHYLTCVRQPINPILLGEKTLKQLYCSLMTPNPSIIARIKVLPLGISLYISRVSSMSASANVLRRTPTRRRYNKIAHNKHLEQVYWAKAIQLVLIKGKSGGCIQGFAIHNVCFYCYFNLCNTQCSYKRTGQRMRCWSANNVVMCY